MSDLYGEQYLSERDEDFIDALIEKQEADRLEEQYQSGEMSFDVAERTNLSSYQKASEIEDNEEGFDVVYCPDCGRKNLSDKTDLQCMCDNCEKIFSK